MSDNPVYLNPNNNIAYGDVVKVDGVSYIKTEHTPGTRTHYLSSFTTSSICNNGECCIDDLEELQQHVETDFLSAARTHRNMNDWEWSYNLQQWNRFPNESDVGVNMRWSWRTKGGSPGYSFDVQEKYDWQWTDFVYTSPTYVTGNPRGNYWTGRKAPLFGRPVPSMPGVYTHWNDRTYKITRLEPDSYRVYIRNKITQKIFPYTEYQTTTSNVSRRVYASNDEQNKLRTTAGRWATVTTGDVQALRGWLTTNFSALASGSLMLPEPQTPTTDHVDPADMVYLNPDDAVAVGDKILFEGRCYTKTGDTGLMTHALTGQTSDLIIQDAPTQPANNK